MALGGGTFGSNSTYIGHMESGPDGIRISGSKTECPRCHQMADIPDGLYDTTLGIVRQGLRVLRSLSLAEASVLAEIVRQRQRGEADDAAVVAATPDEAKPWIAAVLRNQWTPFFLSVLLALVLYFKADATGTASEQRIVRTEQQKQTQVHALHEQESEVEGLVRQMITDLRVEQPGNLAPDNAPRRNDPCWCGVPTKYKFCHGAR